MLQIHIHSSYLVTSCPGYAKYGVSRHFKKNILCQTILYLQLGLIVKYISTYYFVYISTFQKKIFLCLSLIYDSISYMHDLAIQVSKSNIYLISQSNSLRQFQIIRILAFHKCAYGKHRISSRGHFSVHSRNKSTLHEIIFLPSSQFYLD